MIYMLSGNVVELLDDAVVLDVSGVGYLVYVPKSLVGHFSSGQFTKLYTYHYIREDQQTLYGFQQSTDRQLFVTLTSVSGLGPKVAMKMLSDLDAAQLVQAILSENLVILTQISGVGKKLAERLVVELKDKLEKWGGGVGGVSGGGAVAVAVLKDDIGMALKTLGYSGEEVRRALSAATALSADMTLESGIKHVLSKMGSA